MKVGLIVVAVTFVIYWSLSIFGAIAVMRVPRLPLDDSPASVGLVYEDISFPSRYDDIELKGWFIPGGGDFVIVVIPGGFQNRVDYNVNTLGLARDLVGKQYDVLMFDLRGRGESEGKGLVLMNIDRDIGGAIDYLKNEGYSANSIAIIGFCTGATSSCIFAHQESIGALVLVGCYPYITDMVVTQAALRGIPEFLVRFFIPGVLSIARIIYGFELINPIDVIDDVNCPILFIHEEYDDSITLEDNHQLNRESGSDANEVWEISSANHSQGYKTHPHAFVEKVANFLSTRR